jgi:hypothetical protein
MNNVLRKFPVREPLSPQCLSVLRTLLYFDIFNYPLTAAEIMKFSSASIQSTGLLAFEIDHLISEELVHRFGEFYTLHKDEGAVEQRLKGNQEAARLMPLAQKRARLISRFPFVRAVMASGSLSKGYMDEKSDLDFFVVTAPNRLWIARTLFVLYRKAFVPKSRHKEFCTNYFLSADKLRIEEKNLFTATELATLIPLSGLDSYYKLMLENNWIHEYLPNFVTRDDWELRQSGKERIKNMLEKMISSLAGPKLDRWLMNFTLRRFEQKYRGRFTDAEFALALKSKPFVSKVHLSNNQSRILSLLQLKISDFESKSAIAFDHG